MKKFFITNLFEITYTELVCSKCNKVDKVDFKDFPKYIDVPCENCGTPKLTSAEYTDSLNNVNLVKIANFFVLFIMYTAFLIYPIFGLIYVWLLFRWLFFKTESTYDIKFDKDKINIKFDDKEIK